MDQLVLLLVAGLVAGAMNALAGGGSFVTLPALIAAGVPSVSANASSTVALYPGGLASAWVYRAGLSDVCGVPLKPTFAVTLLGGFLGALLLLWTPNTAFDRVLPWLLLLATLALAAGPKLASFIRMRFQGGLPLVLSIQLLLGIYGGYFGGAVGLMMMATWGLLGTADLKSLNPPRTLLVSASNTVAVLCFAIAGVVEWVAVALVGGGAILGGYAGAHLGKRLPSALVRATTLLIATAMTAAFFLRAYV